MTSCRAATAVPLDAERQALVVKWHDYAVGLARNWCRLWYQVGHTDDVRAEAVLGLVEGAQRWNPKRGSFASCAHWYIMNRLRMYERRGVRIVALGGRGATPSPDERSLDAPLQGHNGPSKRATLHDVVPGDSGGWDSEGQDAALLFAQLEDTLVMYDLSRPYQGEKAGREARARRNARIFIGWRYLDQKLEELGAQEGVTRERARQCILLMQRAFDAWAAEHRAESEGKSPPVRRVGGAR